MFGALILPPVREENISQVHRDYTEWVTVLEEAWRRFKKHSATLTKHLSEELLLLPVVLCLEDLKSISITERSCRELYNNHLQIWQSKVRILILQFISFDILSVISPFPHNLFILRGRWHITYSLDCWERQLFLSPFSLSLSVSFFLSLVLFPPWILLVVSSISPCLFYGSFKGEGRIMLASAWTQNTAAERARAEDFGHVAHSQGRVSQHAPLGTAGLYFKQRPKLRSFHFQRAWRRSLGSSEVQGRRKLAFRTGLAVDTSARLRLPPSCPGELQGLRSTRRKRARSRVIIFIQPGFSLPWASLSLALIG